MIKLKILFRKVKIFFELLILILFFNLVSVSSSASSIYVAFLEFHKDGERIALEPGGRFGHVAVFNEGQWFHAFPPRHVETIDKLDRFGKLTVILELSKDVIVDERFLMNELGKETTVQSEWSDDQTTYCSKLVGQFLGLSPKPCDWSAQHWEQVPLNKRPNTRQGLSPDDIFEALVRSPHLRGKREYKKIRCGDALRS
jgi:hypothetical protein